jgi:hypothetical protein
MAFYVLASILLRRVRRELDTLRGAGLLAGRPGAPAKR